jgi:hypothetical protein
VGGEQRVVFAHCVLVWCVLVEARMCVMGVGDYALGQDTLTCQ